MMATEQLTRQTEKEIEERKVAKVMGIVAERAAFYRANPHRLAKDYLNINLKIFQQLILWLMFYDTNFMYLAARGRHDRRVWRINTARPSYFFRKGNHEKNHIERSRQIYKR